MERTQDEDKTMSSDTEVAELLAHLDALVGPLNPNSPSVVACLNYDWSFEGQEDVANSYESPLVPKKEEEEEEEEGEEEKRDGSTQEVADRKLRFIAQLVERLFWCKEFKESNVSLAMEVFDMADPKEACNKAHNAVLEFTAMLSNSDSFYNIVRTPKSRDEDKVGNTLTDKRKRTRVAKKAAKSKAKKARKDEEAKAQKRNT